MTNVRNIEDSDLVNTRSSATLGAWLTIAGCVLMGVSTALPWIKSPIGLTQNAFSLESLISDIPAIGPILLILACVGFALALGTVVGGLPYWTGRLVFVIGVLAALLTAISYPSLPGNHGTAYGYWIGMAGSLITFAGGAILFNA